MSNIFDSLVKSDPLKAFEGLLHGARLDPRESGENKPITIVLLILVSASLALAKTLYASGDFSLIQHFAVTAILIVSAYITIGVTLMLFRVKYDYYSRLMLNLFLCIIAAAIFITVSLLFLGSFSPHIIDMMANLVAAIFGNQLNAPQWVLGAVPLFADLITSALYSFIGCLVVLSAIGASHKTRAAPRPSLGTQAWLVVMYFLLTTATIFFLAIERQQFFDNAMIQFSKIELFK